PGGSGSAAHKGRLAVEVIERRERKLRAREPHGPAGRREELTRCAGVRERLRSQRDLRAGGAVAAASEDPQRCERAQCQGDALHVRFLEQKVRAPATATMWCV